jgi:hypothetical protein
MRIRKHGKAAPGLTWGHEMISYSDYTPAESPIAVIGGIIAPVDSTVIHSLAVNAMALAVAIPSFAPQGKDAAADPAVA